MVAEFGERGKSGTWRAASHRRGQNPVFASQTIAWPFVGVGIGYLDVVRKCLTATGRFSMT